MKSAIVVCRILVLAGAVLACGSTSSPDELASQGEAIDAELQSGTASESELGVSHVIGADQLVDLHNNFTVELPAGWYAIVPRLGRGSTTIANYDMREVENRIPDFRSDTFLPEMIKIDIIALPREPDTHMQHWIDRRQSHAQHAMAGSNRVEGERIPCRLAGRNGYAYTVPMESTPAVEVALPWEVDRVLLTTLLPVEGQQLAKALAVLDELRMVDEARSERESQRDVDARDLGTNLPPLSEAMTVAPMAINSCSSWYGSDNAPGVPNSPIALNLPFYWGTWWQAGGAGYFFGNGTHGNCYDDYYAIDFNRVSDSSCSSYLDDSGQRVYPSASGTAYPYYSSSGYGNRVDVYHSNGIMTRYAHLQNTNVSWAQWVDTQTVIGWVGTTGNSGGPHLHYGFYRDGVSRCNDASGWCPNGEASEAPQTAKPSPMYTNNGTLTMYDYHCYQAPP